MHAIAPSLFNRDGGGFRDATGFVDPLSLAVATFPATAFRDLMSHEHPPKLTRILMGGCDIAGLICCQRPREAAILPTNTGCCSMRIAVSRADLKSVSTGGRLAAIRSQRTLPGASRQRRCTVDASSALPARHERTGWLHDDPWT